MQDVPPAAPWTGWWTRRLQRLLLEGKPDILLLGGNIKSSHRADNKRTHALLQAFKKNGVGTAGNASIISDGAAAVVVMSREKAESLGCQIMATIGAQASYGIDMRYVLVAPIWAVPKCLAKEGIGLDDVDLFEINEAFSGSTAAVIKELQLNPEKVNVKGGSVSLGHPIGASGARILTTLLYALEQRKKRFGLATLCIGGGEASALIVERM